MNTITTKQQLINLILILSSEDYTAFLDNYNIKDKGRDLIEFIKELDKETTEEVINEINFNTNYKY